MALLLGKIDEHGDRISGPLSELVVDCRPDWSVEQAIELCRTGAWILLVADDDPGFAMFSVQESKYSGVRQLVIHAVCMPEGSKGTAYYDQFWDLMAGNLGCAEIVMESNRRGWERRGWDLRWIRYSRQVKGV